jgi:hypothetical protein
MMKLSLFLILMALLPNLLYADLVRVKGLYGDDNRRALSESNSLEQKLALSVLAQVPLYKMSNSDESTISFLTTTPIATLNLCSTEKFSAEAMLASCTGFLVAPDLLLTASHCIKDKSDCQKNIWLLDYDESKSIFSRDKVVFCKEIVDTNALADYSLIRLSRSILDRDPLKIRQNGKLNPNAEFVVIGHPLGLPKVVADQAFLRGNLLNKTFTISSDTYSGNSGSPVIDIKTSLVEGVLIKGDRDYEMDFESQCMRSVHCDHSTCMGETVLRSIYIPSALLPPTLH